MPSVFRVWGTRPDEILLGYPCDRFLDVLDEDDFDEAYYRGTSIHAPPEIIFRWLCQLRIAPYSYDWVDNFGRKSPSTLTPGLEELRVGQDVMTIFELVDFEEDRQLTIRMKRGLFGSKAFGDTVVSYLIEPDDGGNCRLLVKLLIRYPKGILGWLTRLILPLGDLIMMRRQLLNFKELSERTQDVTEGR